MNEKQKHWFHYPNSVAKPSSPPFDNIKLLKAKWLAFWMSIFVDSCPSGHLSVFVDGLFCSHTNMLPSTPPPFHTIGCPAFQAPVKKKGRFCLHLFTRQETVFLQWGIGLFQGKIGKVSQGICFVFCVNEKGRSCLCVFTNKQKVRQPAHQSCSGLELKSKLKNPPKFFVNATNKACVNERGRFLWWRNAGFVYKHSALERACERQGSILFTLVYNPNKKLYWKISCKIVV